MRSFSIVLGVSLALLVRGVRSEECGVRIPSSSDTTVVSAAEVSSLLTPHSTLPEETTILLTGDILLDRGVRQAIERHGVSHLFSEGVDSVFQSAQVVVGNLECPATKIKSPVFKRFIFRGEPEWLDTLRQHGITHLNLANNHSIDQGREGLIDTRNNILASGMVPIGAGENMQEAAEPVLLASEPRKVWLVPSLRLALENYAYLPDKPCVSQEPMDSLLARVYRLRQQDSTAVIIVSLHWGQEHKLEPVPRQRHDAHMLVHAGADVLVCHHTHTLQSVEDYGGRKIYYSIGNFIFDQPKPLNARAAMVRLRITADSLCVETLPVEIRHCAPYIK
ncbi:MAG: CapA family protein [Prevotella sp.]|nr:CapA family protein [Prevotella sp.]